MRIEERSPTAWADQLQGVLDALGIERASVAGQSMGGGVAAVFAARHPSRIDRLLPLAGGAPATLALAESPRNIALRADTVYFTSYYGTPRIDGVFAVTRTGGDASPLVLDQSGPLGIAVDATHVYWVNSSGPQSFGSIVKAPLTGGTPTTLATHLDVPTELVVDATSVYFTTPTAVMKLSPK